MVVALFYPQGRDLKTVISTRLDRILSEILPQWLSSMQLFVHPQKGQEVMRLKRLADALRQLILESAAAVLLLQGKFNRFVVRIVLN